jgi:hypothetical protein
VARDDDDDDDDDGQAMREGGHAYIHTARMSRAGATSCTASIPFIGIIAPARTSSGISSAL